MTEDLKFSFRKVWENDGKLRKGQLFEGHLVKVIDLETVEKIIGWYLDNNGSVTELQEGTLGYGKILCTGVENCPSILITERYVNEWSCDHTFRVINKLSKKLLKEMEKSACSYVTLGLNPKLNK